MTLLLTLSNVDHLENGEPTQLRLDRHGAVIGRSPHSDWSLPDPKSYVSSTHCEIDYRDGGYVLIDKSTNGTFVNGGAQRLAGPHPLKDGDVISIGHYRVGVSGTGPGAATGDAAATPPPPAAAGGDAGWGGWGGGAAPAPAGAPSPGWASASAPAASAQAPAAAPAASAWGGEAPAAAPGWGAPDAKAEPQQTPPEAPAAASGWGAVDSARAAPAPSWGATPAEAPASTPAAGWDAAPAPPGWDAAPAPPGWDAAPAPPGWQAAASASAAGESSVWGAAGAGPAKPAASGWDPLAPAREAQTAERRAEAAAGGSPMSGLGALSGAWAAPRMEAPAAAPAPLPSAPADVWGAMAASNTVDWSRGGFGAADAPAAAAPPPPAAPAPGPDGAAWSAFLAAAGVQAETLKAPSQEAAATAGAVVKRLVAGLVVMMEARARAKAQLGAQSTTLELKGNNPLKFARSPERVLAQLLNPPERGFMGASDAVEDSFRDLQAHQMATLAAMQGALRATLDRFSPAAIRKRAEMRGVLARILPGARNATLWEAYEREFEGVAKGSDEAFMDVFAKAFKEAYEQAAIQMKSQGG